MAVLENPSSPYWRIVRAVQDVDHRATLRIARAIYPALRDWLRARRERLGRAAVLRHPRKVRQLVERELPKAPPLPPPLPLPPPVVETWDVTIHYASEGQVVDVGMRIEGRGYATRDLVRAVAWRALLQLPIYREGDAWRATHVYGVNWRREVKGSTYENDGSVLDLSAFVPMARKGQWRIEPVDED